MSGTRGSTDAVVDRFLAEGDTDSGTPDTDSNSGNVDDAGNGVAESNTDTVERADEDKADTTATDPNGRQTAGNAATQQRTGKPDQSRGVQKPNANAQQRGGQGDIIDPHTGAVIARAGSERRLYEARMRAERDAATVRGQLASAQAELVTFREASQLPAQLKLTPDETVLGLQMMAAWKNNPVETVKYLIEQAKANGHNIDALAGPGTDMGAIRTMIHEAVSPLRQRHEQEQQLTEAQRHAETELNNFTQQYGREALDANGAILADLLNKSREAGQPLTLENAYVRFENWCLRNRLDPMQPIRAQMAARDGQDAAPPQQRAARPNGRGASMQTPAVNHDPNAATTGNERTRDLVREAMRENGFQV